jgi:hypothetical protein
MSMLGKDIRKKVSVIHLWLTFSPYARRKRKLRPSINCLKFESVPSDIDPFGKEWKTHRKGI